MIRGQINSFPDGHFVAIYNNKIVGYCASIRLPESKVTGSHNWKEITGGGYGTTHVENGDYLYGYEVCVDPEFRRLKIGQRFYNERKKLCKHLHMKGIVFAGRLPNLAEKIEQCGSPEKYLEAVEKTKRSRLRISIEKWL